MLMLHKRSYPIHDACCLHRLSVYALYKVYMIYTARHTRASIAERGRLPI